MQAAAAAEQVAAILTQDGLDFQTRPDGLSFQLQFGSAAVFIDFHVTDQGWAVITVYSPVLQEIDPRVPESAEGLGFLNTLNRTYDLVKFTFADGALLAECDLLGDTLHPDALRYVLASMAELADRLDDQLSSQIGGKRFVTALKEFAEGEEPA